MTIQNRICSRLPMLESVKRIERMGERMNDSREIAKRQIVSEFAPYFPMQKREKMRSSKSLV
jgi:hypothetical protein